MNMLRRSTTGTHLVYFSIELLCIEKITPFASNLIGLLRWGGRVYILNEVIFVTPPLEMK